MLPPGHSHPMEIRSTIGEVPTFWDRNVIFIANLLGLFFGNEEETRMLADEVGEVDSYGGRLLSMLDLVYRGNGENHLALERSPDEALVEYFRSCGLSLPGFSVLTHGEYVRLGPGGDAEHPFLDLIRELDAEALDGYVTDHILAAVAERTGKRTISTPEGSREGNNKTLLHQFLESRELPLPPTELAEKPGEIEPALARLKAAGYSAAVIRAALGASGIGMVKVTDLSSRGEVAMPGHFFREGPCLVQAWLKPGEFGVTSVRSPSVQLFLAEDEVRLFDTTEQILSEDSVHEGNESPPFYVREHRGLQDELLRQAGMAGEWLHGRGYRGTASVDFLVTFREGIDYTVHVCEINARVTGATYPSVLARHFLPEGAWLLRNLRFLRPLPGKDLLDLLRDSGDLFVPGESEFGVFPVNFNHGKDDLVHKGQFLCLSKSRLGNRQLLHLAELDLPCRAERD